MNKEILTETLKERGLTLSETMADSLVKYVSLLKEWNEKMNLTSILDENEIYEKHFLDSLLPSLSPSFVGSSILDVGSGAGFPGIVLAIAYPDRQITLIEATGKKCTFLEAVKEALGLKNVRILNLRAEDFHERDSFDIVTARALAPLSPLLEITAPFAKIGGIVVAMKGSKGREELADSKEALRKLNLKLVGTVSDTLPECQESRLSFFFKKTGPIPTKFPRPWADIHKKPL